MEHRKPREYQTIRLFATLGFLTLLFVLLFKVVLFAPHEEDKIRMPAQLPKVVVETLVLKK